MCFSGILAALGRVSRLDEKNFSSSGSFTKDELCSRLRTLFGSLDDDEVLEGDKQEVPFSTEVGRLELESGPFDEEDGLNLAPSLTRPWREKPESLQTLSRWVDPALQGS